IGSLLEYAILARFEIERDETGGKRRRSANENRKIALHPKGCELREGQIQPTKDAACNLDHGEVAEPGLRIGANDAAGSGKGISGQAENPLRLSEFRRHRRKRSRSVCGEIEPVEIPPAR